MTFHETPWSFYRWRPVHLVANRLARALVPEQPSHWLWTLNDWASRHYIPELVAAMRRESRSTM